MITVISTTLNAKDLIKSTYESVRSQKDAEFEYLVIDGESNDGSTELYDQWTLENDWFHYVSENDRGIYAAMNKAVLYAHGDYFIFLDAGDTFVDEYTLNTISKALADKPCDILYGYVYLWNIDGSKTAYVRKIDFNYALRANPVCHQAIVAKKEMFTDKPFDVDYRYAADQDWTMWAYKNKKKIRYIDVPFVNYDMSDTTSRSLENCYRETKEIHKKYYPILYNINVIFGQFRWKWLQLTSNHRMMPERESPMKIYLDTQIYILCPAHWASGGPDALHQLRYYMEKCGYKAKMAYIEARGEDPKEWTPYRYHKYLHNGEDTENAYSSIRIEDIEDCEKNIVIGYESFSRVLQYFRNCRVAIWWLSVRFFDGDAFLPDDLWSFSPRVQLGVVVKNCLKKMLKHILPQLFKSVPNFVGSKYARLYLKSRGVKAAYMVEPISMEFLNEGMYDTVDGREDIILYNPAKNSKIMHLLLERGKFNYVPLKGYTPQQMIQLMRKSKLYVDFGDFPGPERIPKEAVWNGCNILVGRKHAAENDFDVAIPEQYKIRNYNVENVERKIQEMLEHFEVQHHDFDAFRKKIAGLEEGFEESIRQNFVREDRNYE